jgi:hypothetical protein
LIEKPLCPVCSFDGRRDIGKRTYAKTDFECLGRSARMRHQVLFEAWFPNKDAVTPTAKLCENCGVVIYAPRPNADDIDRKYRFLAKLEPSITANPLRYDVERRRARELYDHATRFVPRGILFEFLISVEVMGI